MPPKKVTELITLLLDVNKTANSSTGQTGYSDFDVSSSIADAIICRKIFSGSPDLCSVVLFGFDHRSEPGCYISNEFEKANFFAVEKLDEVKPGTSSTVTVQAGLEFAIKKIKEYKRENPKAVINSTIFLLSNLDSTPAAMLTEASAQKLATKLEKHDIELFVASPNETINDNKSPKIRFIGELNATWMSFGECKTKFGSFIPKQVSPRGMPFELKLDEKISIELQMYTKNAKAAIDHKFLFCNEKGDEEMKKHFQHSTRPDIDIDMKDLDEIFDDEFVTGKFTKAEEGKRLIDKDDIVKAFYYGKSVVPADDDIKQEFLEKKLGKELNLIQFTSKDNILPQYILTTPRYLLPNEKEKARGSQIVMMSLVKEMLEKNLVAIVRYAYNVRASARIVCLIPKITKNGLPIFIHYQLPHGDDMRNYEFAYLDAKKSAEDDDDFQKDSVSGFIDALMLDDDDKRPKNMPCPRIQHECLQLRSKALDPGDEIKSYAYAKELLADCQIPESKEIVDVIKELLDAFPLEINERNRIKDFGNRPLGMDPIDFKAEGEENSMETKKEE